MTTEKRQGDYDDLKDFGYMPNPIPNGAVKYIQCQTETTLDGSLPDQIYPNGDSSVGGFFTLEDILSGGSVTISVEDATKKDQAELSLDNSLSTSLAYFGSVYSTIQIAINDIKENYPNGFLIITAITGVNAFMFNASDTYMYGGVPFKILDYSDYELVQTYNDVYNNTFQILEQITGTTFSLFLEVDGQPSNGVGYDHIIQPKQATLDKFYSTVSQYGLDLLIPPHDRINYWPRDLLAPNNILFDGTRYDDFIEAELTWATNADDEEANFIWRKLYPDGQKNLDSSDGLMQKLVLTFAMNFDNIKRYQDQLRYQHTIGYDMSNHISKDLVGLMADQWNWNIGHKLNQDDYSKYIYSTYENYITGQSQQKISAKDINFEMQRRILANLVTLYKKKGTREAIKYIGNMYGLPEELFWIGELVAVGNKKELVESESNIVVPMSGAMYYIDESGSAKTLSYRNITNTKYLNINISPFDAIDYDFYDWGWDNHPNITNINGLNTVISSTTETSKNDFFSKVYRNTIKSDGSVRYSSNYPLLEKEGTIYYSTSPNKLKLSTLDPYINFLDDNWNILISNLVPASSRILSIGTLYKNPMWRREKFQWNIGELTPKPLPFNEVLQLPTITPTVKIVKTKVANIPINDPSVSFGGRVSATIALPVVTSKNVQTMVGSLTMPTTTAAVSKTPSVTIQLNEPIGEYIEALVDSDDITCTYSGQSYNIGSPMFEPMSGQYGTLDYENYNTSSLIVSNKTTVDIPFTGYNLSDSGYTKFELELFKKEYGNSIIFDDSITHSIVSVDYEAPTYGKYQVSNLKNISEYDYISVSSDYLPCANEIVLVTYINTGTSRIRTSPSIGIPSMVTGDQPIITFKRIVDFFNWMEPIQSMRYSNYVVGDDGNFNLPVINVTSRTSGNTFSTSGTVTIGGLDRLHSNILVDKEEYFYRSRAITHAPIDWGYLDGLFVYPASGGGSLLNSEYESKYINNIRYYGRYFTFINTPKIPIASLVGVIDNVSVDAYVTSTWNGVGDSDRLELQYLKVYSSNTPFDSYTAITESAWTTTSSTTIPVPARKNVGDEYIYTIQTTLEGDTYYWWRVKNIRGKLNMFGNNLECFTSTKPTWFKTGTYVNIGGNEGEIPIEPKPPTRVGKIPTIDPQAQ